ncbi:hypothetical protein OsJ_08643 [Oryza sativa Japonica Group]|uniref:Uncharacterized protein n=1 Tax=Oryza sativa subsp. japonica TaxID=39947 RepID=A3AC22_ORYSJ|nr:hypothetical protein OsJ_08643 [Oryza sativa Japonica Group]
MSPDDSGELDPSKIIDQYIVEQNLIDSFARRVMEKIKTKLRIGKIRRKRTMENFGASFLVLSAMVLGGSEDAQFGRLAACFGSA